MIGHASDQSEARRRISLLLKLTAELSDLARRQDPAVRQAMMTNIIFIESNLVGLQTMVEVDLADRGSASSEG